MKVLTLEAAEQLLEKSKTGSITIADDTFVSRDAKLFLETQGIVVNKFHDGQDDESKKPFALRREKLEYMTNLNAKEMVCKNHPRIRFRGKLDSFQAEVLTLEVRAQQRGEMRLLERLEEVLQYSRNVLVAEVMDRPLGHIELFGLDEGQLRYVSQHPKEHFGVGHIAPTYDMGEICIALNALRASSRELELAGIDAFCNPPKIEREDILQALNRISSGIYIIYCQYLQESGVAGKTKG